MTVPERPPAATPQLVTGSVLRARLRHWAIDRFGTDATVGPVNPMPGNSGLSFGFVVDRPGLPPSKLVIRLAPPGVRKSRNTDVLHQVPLLDALHAAGIPVAPVVWHTDDPSWFGTDAVVQPFLPARPLHMYDPAAAVVLDAGSATETDCLRNSVRTLARIHEIDWRGELGTWEAVRPVEEEIDFWFPLLVRSGEPATVELASELRDLLLATVPKDTPVGLVHGDYQTNNVLFDPAARVVAVLDWELAGIGEQLLDLAWLSMMTDLSFWGPEQRDRMRITAPAQRLAEWYEAASGRPVVAFDWYRALAAYRFGAIVAFNLRLHRTGRRPDAAYELLASSVPALFHQGRRLIGG